MSLSRLLAASRSVDGKTKLPNYKMMSALPKFAAAKRPISLAPAKQSKTEEKQMSTPSLFEQAAKTAAPAPAKSVAPASEAPGVLSVGVFQPAVAAAPRKEGWLAKLKNLFGRKRDFKASAPIQAEWSLDKVTVVRNDLLEDDLEVVLADVKNLSAEQQRAEKRKIVGSAWRRQEVKVVKPAEQAAAEEALK